MPLSPDQIVSLYQERAKIMSPLHTQMREIDRIYDGAHEVTIADMNRNERAAVPNLLSQGVDQMAGRIASVVPQAFFTSENPGKREADRRARTAMATLQGWWEQDNLPLKMSTRARHLIAHGMSPVTITYSRALKRPTWTVRKATECFPSMEVIPGTATPTDVIFAYRRSASWLVSKGYAPQVARLMPNNSQVTKDLMFVLLEYMDSECHHLLLVGAIQPGASIGSYFTPGARFAQTLEYAENPAGVPMAHVPMRVSLSRLGGQFDSMISMYYMQSKLMSLDLAAIERGVYPDTWAVSRPGELARIEDGPHDGRTGRINILTGGDIKQMDTNPGYKTDQAIDRLERSQRLTAGIPAEFGGESATNIRTGRRGDQVLSGVIDFPVAEAQAVFAMALEEEDRSAIALAKFYDGDTTRSIYVGTGNAAKKVTYQASKVFSHDEHTVAYPVSGADINSLIMGLGQRIGMGTLSKRSGMEMDPWITSAETEHDQIIAEGLEMALIGGIQQQAAAGAIPPLVLGKIMDLVANDKMELPEALVKATEDAQKAQMEDQVAGPSADAAAAPATEAALAGTIPGPSEAQQSLSTLLTSIRKPMMGIQPRLGSQPGGGVAL